MKKYEWVASFPYGDDIPASESDIENAKRDGWILAKEMKINDRYYRFWKRLYED